MTTTVWSVCDFLYDSKQERARMGLQATRQNTLSTGDCRTQAVTPTSSPSLTVFWHCFFSPTQYTWNPNDVGSQKRGYYQKLPVTSINLSGFSSSEAPASKTAAVAPRLPEAVALTADAVAKFFMYFQIQWNLATLSVLPP